MTDFSSLTRRSWMSALLRAASPDELDRGNIVVLRSFGKFFGLAGLRLGFALAAPHLAARLNASLGPWAVSGPAIAIGEQALADTAWMDATRNRLAAAAQRLDRLLAELDIEVVGGTSLFRLARTPSRGRHLPASWSRWNRRACLSRTTDLAAVRASERRRLGLLAVATRNLWVGSLISKSVRPDALRFAQLRTRPADIHHCSLVPFA